MLDETLELKVNRSEQVFLESSVLFILEKYVIRNWNKIKFILYCGKKTKVFTVFLKFRSFLSAFFLFLRYVCSILMHDFFTSFHSIVGSN